jgi:hypothetical protein
MQNGYRVKVEVYAGSVRIATHTRTVLADSWKAAYSIMSAYLLSIYGDSVNLVILQAKHLTILD